MIKFLKNNEKNETKKIWEIVFPEDTKNFLNYYYSEKNIDNEIIVKLIENEIVSMIHLNPYSVLINNELLKTYYIVAVATLKNHRKKGYMAELLNSSIHFMHKEKIPFAFLRPAKEEIYLPFDFRYIYNHDVLKLKENLSLKEISLEKDKYQFLADFINTYLKENFNVFSERTEKYISTLHKEVKSENGDIILLYKNSDFIGCYIYWGIDEKIVRAIFSKKNIFKIKEEKPLVMARIIDLNSFFKNITSKNTGLNLIINLTDEIILENNGLFEIKINTTNSSIQKIQSYNESDILNISIADLTSLFFGYKNIKEFTNNNDIINLFENINLYNVFLDEEV